jgi:hypothetical protein
VHPAVAVPEGHNIEIARTLSERQRETGSEKIPAAGRRAEEMLEIVEVVFLAIVAIATAWSGYQAAKWDGQQALLYGDATHLRFQADAASTRGGQELVADSAMFNSWLQAHDEGNLSLQRMFERRFSAGYLVAFHAWLATDPFHNPNAPPGPGYMPQLRYPLVEQAARWNDQAAAHFEQGTLARETADKYVRDTVLFASVLFLIAVAQRFKLRGVRIAANSVALALLVFTLFTLIALPRI